MSAMKSRLWMACAPNMEMNGGRKWRAYQDGPVMLMEQFTSLNEGENGEVS